MDNEDNGADEKHLAALFGEAWDNGVANRERAKKWWKIALQINSMKRMPEKRKETGVGEDFLRKMSRSGGYK